jgi:hypothetical protein
VADGAEVSVGVLVGAIDGIAVLDGLGVGLSVRGL